MEQPTTSAQNDSVLLDAIRDLTSTVKDLKHQINVNNAGGQGRTVPSAAGSAMQPMETQISDTGALYSLQSAYAAYQTGQNNVPSPSIQTQSTSTSAVRTRYGYAADSLSHVNTVPPSSKSDSYGRQRVTYGGQEICNNFNGEKGCNRPRCNNLHVCLV